MNRGTSALLLTVFFGVRIGAFSPLQNELPVDETEARSYLEAGIIDSTLWRSLVPLYRRPLQVPDGEAVQLSDLFPEIADVIPTDQTELHRYRPWDKAAQQRFFNDYPVMEKLKPVLQFEYHPSRYSGGISFFMNRAERESQAFHSLRYSVAPVANTLLQGTVDFTADYARWERRSLSVRPFSWATVQLGNFAVASDPGLIYGYFPDDTVSGNDPASNWFFGSAKTWNGAAVTVSGKKVAQLAGFKPSLTGFVHSRPSESVAGASAVIIGRKEVAITCGVSRLVSDSTAAGQMYLHGHLKAAFARLVSELQFGVTLAGKTAVPLLWKNILSYENCRAQVTFTHLPGGFYAPRSALLRRFGAEFDGRDTLRSSISLVRVSVAGTSARPISIGPRCEVWFEKGYIHHGACQLQIVFRRRPVDGTVILSGDFPGCIGLEAGGSIEGSFVWSPLPELSVTALQRYSLSGSGRRRYRGTISPAVCILSRIHLEPTLSVISETGRSTEYLTGIRQKLVLFDRTYTEFVAEQDVRTFTTGERLRIEGRATFNF